MLIRVLSIVLSFLMLLGGLLVLSRNPKGIANRVFSAFTVIAAIWGQIFVNIETPGSIDTVRLLNAISFAFGLLAITTASLFTAFFPVRKPLKLFKKYLILAIPTIILSLTPLIAGNVEKVDGNYNFINGPIVTLYAIVFIIGMVVTIVQAFGGYKNFTTAQKQQSKLVAMGLSIAFIMGIVLSTIIPIYDPLTKVDDLSPLSLVFIVYFVTLAMVRHGFMDIRLIVARAVGYLLSLAVISGIYSLLVFGILARFIDNQSGGTGQQIVYVILAVILALTFQPVKKFFDKFSNKIFYQDAYDAQELLDSLNTTLVSNIELNILLRKSAEIISSNIKTEYVLFAINEQGETPARVIGTKEKSFDADDIIEARTLTPQTRAKVILADELEERDKLRKLMRKYDVSLLARLSSNPDKAVEGLGYILMGQKRSGSAFTSQDVKVIEIIADEMVIAIQNALRFEEIQQFAVTLQQKVDDATRNLKRANQKLKDLDEAKDEFISMASHQLRTPLTSMKGYVSMVLEGDAGKVSSMQRRLLDQAFVSSQRMVYLIADLLNVSRLKTGKFVIETKPTNLSQIVEEEISQLYETAKGRNLELTYQKPKSFPELMLDETKIRQVVMNFTDNAIYYTPSGGHIKVVVEDKGDSVEMRVEDDGLGVPKAEQHHLFSKFYRAGNAKKARPDGTGLGLFMAKKVVVAQGGSIIFHSQESKGSTFGFSFAKSKLQPPTVAQ